MYKNIPGMICYVFLNQMPLRLAFNLSFYTMPKPRQAKRRKYGSLKGQSRCFCLGRDFERHMVFSVVNFERISNVQIYLFNVWPSETCIKDKHDLISLFHSLMQSCKRLRDGAIEFLHASSIRVAPRAKIRSEQLADMYTTQKNVRLYMKQEDIRYSPYLPQRTFTTPYLLIKAYFMNLFFLRSQTNDLAVFSCMHRLSS